MMDFIKYLIMVVSCVLLLWFLDFLGVNPSTFSAALTVVAIVIIYFELSNIQDRLEEIKCFLISDEGDEDESGAS